MEEKEIERIEALMHKRDLGIPSDPHSRDKVLMELADEVPGLVAAVKKLKSKCDALSAEYTKDQPGSCW